MEAEELQESHGAYCEWSSFPLTIFLELFLRTLFSVSYFSSAIF